MMSNNEDKSQNTRRRFCALTEACAYGPVGMILPFDATSLPRWVIPLNGQQVQIERYPLLYNTLGPESKERKHTLSVKMPLPVWKRLLSGIIKFKPKEVKLVYTEYAKDGYFFLPDFNSQHKD